MVGAAGGWMVGGRMRVGSFFLNPPTHPTGGLDRRTRREGQTKDEDFGGHGFVPAVLAFWPTLGRREQNETD